MDEGPAENLRHVRCKMSHNWYAYYNQPVTVTHIHRQEGPIFQDSIEIGTPGKGGSLKIYFNAADVEDAKTRVRNAFLVRDYAQDLLEKKR